ncbi:MAG: hypothetical protein DMF93_17255 [Acidobacteria bacterium]|nr:MAG: hypothetical protein DMF93_17255 [Acidobacteriota bacterium]
MAAHGRRLELAAVLAAAIALTALFTYPVAFKPGRVGRVDNGDGQLSIWNVTWVARTLAVDPLHVFDANIFYPNRGTLAYSENNLGAGVLAMPVYWATRNPYAAHNSVVLFAFVLAFVGAYYLVRYLTGDWRAAAVSAVWFAFCPYVFARTAQIQLLMTAGLPFAMLAFHRLADRPSPGRGAALGSIMAAQALCCGYYGIHVAVMIGFAFVVVASTRSLWRDAFYWRAMLVAAAVSIMLVLPAFAPYSLLHRQTGFERTLAEAERYSANWSAWFASSSYAHAWLLAYLPPWKDTLFPGAMVTAFAIAGLFIARKQRRGELALLYGGLVAFAVWLSFGPRARLYSTLYTVLPIFRWLRAPSRFGLIVVLSLSVLGSLAVVELCRRARRPTLVFAALFVVCCVELIVPLNMPDVPPLEPVYMQLTELPPGPLIEMPFFYLGFMFPRHTYYMLQSTTHWMPLVNGYSDYMPRDFLANVMTLAPFPSRDSLRLLHHRRVRYAVFHRYWYNDENWRDVTMRLREFDPYLRMIYKDEGTRLYEIVGAPR